MARRKKKSTSKHTPEVFRRATYYLRPGQIRALKLRAATEDRQLSDLMREAVDLDRDHDVDNVRIDNP